MLIKARYGLTMSNLRECLVKKNIFRLNNISLIFQTPNLLKDFNVHVGKYNDTYKV